MTQTPPHARQMPFALPLDEALRHIDRTFGIQKILSEQGRDIVAPYYVQSEPGYARIHSHEGCMHMALNHDGQFHPDGYLEHSREVSRHIQALDAKRVLELGSGMGFNSITLGPQHPDVTITGLDLLPHHIARANTRAQQAGLKNVSFRKGSYLDIPDDLCGVDLIFAIETLCHTSSLDGVARQIARALKPGGRLVLFDGYRRADFETAPADVITAARLFEITTAVTTGFRKVAEWQSALENAGLRVTRIDDLTDSTIPTLRKLQARSYKFFTSWKYRMLRYVMPKYLVWNAVAGLAGPFMIEGPQHNQGRAQACLSYNLIIAEKPL